MTYLETLEEKKRKKKQEVKEKFVKLVQENPDLPVVVLTYVSGNFQEDDMFYGGYLNKVEIEEYLEIDAFTFSKDYLLEHLEEQYGYDESFLEFISDYGILKKIFKPSVIEGISSMTLRGFKKHINKLPWKKGILVYTSI